MREKDRYSNKELTDRQKKYIKNLYNTVNKEAKGTVKLIRRIKNKFRYIESEQIKFINRKEILKLVSGISVVTIIYLYVLSYINYNINNTQLYTIPNSTSVVSIQMNEENTLDYSIERLSCKINNTFINVNNIGWLKSNLDTNTNTYIIDNKEISISKGVHLKTFDIQQNYSYVEYSNTDGTGNKELIISEKIPDTIDIKLFQRSGIRFKEKSNPTQIKSIANSHADMFLMLVETIGGGELNIKSLKDELLNIEGYMAKSDNSSGIRIDFKDLGSISLNNIDEVKTSPQLVYDSVNDILQIRNKDEDITYISISKINNEKFGCNAEDLIATNIDNMFITLDFDKENSLGYKTFALIGKDNLYCFRLNKLSHISLMNNILNQLGIENKSIEIKVIQRVIAK